jgi:hypothetical protein
MVMCGSLAGDAVREVDQYAAQKVGDSERVLELVSHAAALWLILRYC